MTNYHIAVNSENKMLIDDDNYLVSLNRLLGTINLMIQFDYNEMVNCVDNRYLLLKGRIESLTDLKEVLTENEDNRSFYKIINMDK